MQLRAYLEALAKRFSDAAGADQRALSVAYSGAMREHTQHQVVTDFDREIIVKA